MTHELRRVLEGESYPDGGLIELGPDQWFDPHASGLKPLDLATALDNRRRLEAATATVRQAQVVFMTLGLTETWIDRETGLAMNRPPGGRGLVTHQDRFRFVEFGFRAILEELCACFALIRVSCNPGMRFVVTVGPVPLGATFRASDVLVSAGASKAVLRAVAEELCRSFDYVDYFPSYEMVMASPRSLAWQPDQAHVSSAMIRHVTDSFLSLCYAGEPAGAGEGDALLKAAVG
jgi:hypothetical protein